MSTVAQNLPLIETVTPADQATVADAVREAGGRGLAVYPVGGGTMLDYGVRPRCPGIALLLSKLTRTIDYPAADMTITVEAGMTIGELNKQLAAHKQRLPVDVPLPNLATVGGAIAVDAAGPRRYAYGTMRDYLLGFTAVDGTGLAFCGGGRVVKNAAGYNMCRLMAGSLGTLGVLTQATLLVRPQAEAAALFACDVPTVELAETLLNSLVQSPVRPAAVELSAGRSPEGNPLFGPISEGNVGRLYVGFEGTGAEVEWMLGRIRQDWTALGMNSPMLLPNLTTDKLWRWISELPADLQINVLPAKLVATIAELLKVAPDCSIHAHAGDGVIRVRLAGGSGEWRVESGERRDEGSGFRVQGSDSDIHHSSFIIHHSLLCQLRTLATAAGGNMTVLRVPDDAPLSRDDVWGPPGPEIVVMRAIKERFDPQNILNPGRFVY